MPTLSSPEASRRPTIPSSLTMDRSASPGRPCPILNLPAELRNMIYSKALPQEELVHITSINIQIPALLRTCRKMRNEAGPMYFTSNRFRITVTDQKGRFAAVAKIWCDLSDVQVTPLEFPGARSLSRDQMSLWLRACYLHNVRVPLTWIALLDLQNSERALQALDFAMECRDAGMHWPEVRWAILYDKVHLWQTGWF